VLENRVGVYDEPEVNNWPHKAPAPRALGAGDQSGRNLKGDYVLPIMMELRLFTWPRYDGTSRIPLDVARLYSGTKGVTAEFGIFRTRVVDADR